MNLQTALSKIHAPKGITSLISGVMAADFDPIREQNAIGATLNQARGKLDDAIQAQTDSKSDWAYWGYEGDRAYWKAVVSILEAAEITGPDNLPDIPDPKQGVVVMDACGNVEKYGRDILAAAQEALRDE